jgi:hypothetical protein
VRWLGFLLPLLLIAAAPPSARMTPEEAAKVDWVVNRGDLLFDIDRAAWVTTDDMIARLGGKRDIPIKGWVVERDGTAPGAFLVTYFGDGPAGRVAWYVGHVRNRKVVTAEVYPEGARPPLTPVQARIADAVSLARAQTQFRPCTPANFNTAAIPPDTPDGPIDVYLLTAMTENGVYPMGGHYLVRVGADGKIVTTRPFTKSCLNMSQPPARSGSEPAALVVGHFLDPMPTEIHVFMSRWIGLPVYVATGQGKKPRVWAVEGPVIRIVQ